MNIDTLKSAADYYKKNENYLSDQEIDFFVSLYKATQKRIEELGAPHADDSNDSFDPAHPSKDELNKEYWAGTPVLAKHPIAVDDDALVKTFEDLSGVVTKDPHVIAQVADVLRGFDWKKFVQDNDPMKLINHPDSMFNAKLDVDVPLDFADRTANTFHIVQMFALRAHLDAVSHAFDASYDARKSQVKGAQPLKCPVCGSTPSISLVGPLAGTDGNGREQFCPVCGATWPFERIRCAVCGSKDQSKLRYQSLEGDPAHRIQTCDVCGEESLVVFQPDLKCEPSLDMEHIVMGKFAMLIRSAHSTK